MGFLRPLPLLCALPLLAACNMDAVQLDGLACPCAEGWVCVDSVCRREDDLPDAAPAPDLGSEEDLGMVDQGVDQGTDGGPADLGMDDDGSDACSAEAYNMTTCDDLCAAAGLVCLEAYDDLNPGCGPDREAPTTCDDATRMGYHCLCIRE